MTRPRFAQSLDWAWLLGSIFFGGTWVVLQCLPFVRPGDHLWQQEVAAYQGNFSLFFLGLLLLAPAVRTWFPALLQDRRWLGLLAFGFALAHTLGAFSHTLGGNWQGWQFLAFNQQIYLGLGLLSLFILTILALTSNDFTVQTLGRTWKILHRVLFYPALLLALVHTVGLGVWYQFNNPQGLTHSILLGVGLLAIASLRLWAK
jgi:DMSO/TMAO reductase YedYZ heme-binding membrane subunit